MKEQWKNNHEDIFILKSTHICNLHHTPMTVIFRLFHPRPLIRIFCNHCRNSEMYYSFFVPISSDYELAYIIVILCLRLEKIFCTREQTYEHHRINSRYIYATLRILSPQGRCERTLPMALYPWAPIYGLSNLCSTGERNRSFKKFGLFRYAENLYPQNLPTTIRSKVMTNLNFKFWNLMADFRDGNQL